MLPEDSEQGSIEQAAEAIRGLSQTPQNTGADDAPDTITGPQADDGGPERERAPVTADDNGENEPDSESRAIVPPASWTAEDKALFSSLPPEIQRTVAGREREREAALHQSRREIAEQKKAIEAESTQAKQERQHYAASLQSHGNVLEKSFVAKGYDKLTPDVIANMGQTDPAKAADFAAHIAAINQVRADSANLHQKQQADFMQFVRDKQAETHEQMVRERPDMFGTPEKAGKTYSEIMTYLTNTYHYPPEKVQVIHDRDTLDIVTKAMLYDRAQAARVKAEKASKGAPPKVVKSGTSGRETSGDERVVAMEQRLRVSGSIEDAAAMLTARARGQRRATR